MPDDTADDGEPDVQLSEEDLSANADFNAGLRLGLQAELGQTGFNDDEARRNHYEVFGWPRDDLDGWDEDNWLALYLRNAYARIVIEKPAFTTWRDSPEVVDAGDTDEPTDFERSVEKLGKNHNLWSYCERADRAAGIGQHGLLLLAFDDVAAWREVLGQSEPGRVERAVEAAVDAHDQGDSPVVAAEWAAEQHLIEHRREDVLRRVREEVEP